MTNGLKEVRCNGTTKKGIPCTQLLGKVDDSYEIKCPKCGKIHTYEADKDK